MTKHHRHRVAGSAVFGIAAAALLASTAAPAMAAERASIDLPATKVSVQVAHEAPSAAAKPAAKTITKKVTAKVAMSVSDETPSPIEPEVDPIDPTPIDPTPIDPTPIDPTPIDPNPVDPGPIGPGPIDPGPVDPGPVDPTPTDPPEPVDPTGPTEPVDPTNPPVGPTTPPVKPTTPPVAPNPKPGTVKPVAPNKPNPVGVKQPESIKKVTTPLQPNGVTKGGAIKAPVKHAQRVAVKTPTGAIQRAVIPAGATSVTPYIPDNAVLVDTGLGAQGVADKDAEFWSIIAGTTLLAGAGAGMVIARRGRRAKS